MIQKINELSWFNFLNKLKEILTEMDSSTLKVGTTATTAKAGNYTPSATEVTTAISAMTEAQKTEVKTALGIA